MKKINSKRLKINHQVLRTLSLGELRDANGGLVNDSLDEKSCNPCGDWPSSPYVGCTL